MVISAVIGIETGHRGTRNQAQYWPCESATLPISSRDHGQTMRTKARSSSKENRTSLPARIQEAIEPVALCLVRELGPRAYVDLMTRSSFEIGRMLKKHLRDAQYTRTRTKFERERLGSN